MKILVAVKRVIDYHVNVRLNYDGSDVETEHVTMSMNPFDEVAVEAAVCLKEAKIADEVIIVSIGTKKSTETVRTALAMGADRGIIVLDDNPTESLNVAKILSYLAKTEDIDLLLLGKQSIDSDASQTGQMTAALLDWPQATFASQIHPHTDTFDVVREIDGGTQTVQLSLPCVITTDLTLNQPRFASLPNLMKAKQKRIDYMDADSLGLDLSSHLTILSLREADKKRAGIRVKNAQELIDKLKQDQIL